MTVKVDGSSLTLVDMLKHAFSRYGQNVAIRLEDEECSYDELNRIGTLVSSEILSSNKEKPRVAIYATKSILAYAGIVAAIFSGGSYVPLNRRFPVERILDICHRSGCKFIFLDAQCAEDFAKIASHLSDVTVICVNAGSSAKALPEHFPHLEYRFLDSHGTPKDSKLCISPDDEAYLMFTSGTTGRPKGVPVRHRNVVAYMENLRKRYDIGPGDKCSQVPDLTFDASVQDIFFSFTTGATLCVIPEDFTFAPAKYIKNYGLTVWHSVPSVVMFMEKFNMLEEGNFPSLRYSFFGGEALTERVAYLWSGAASNSKVDNFYGPTEATVYTSICPVSTDEIQRGEGNGIVSIGSPLPDHSFILIDDEGRKLAAGEVGELCILGPQVVDGYLDDPALSASRFIVTPDGPAYRTGDLARQENEEFKYLGRIDDQIQLRGYRVELLEIDQAIRKGAGSDLAVALPVGLNCSRADAVYAVVQGNIDKERKRRILNHCKKSLPDYMVPSKVEFIEAMPLNSNGKIDRNALSNIYDV